MWGVWCGGRGLGRQVRGGSPTGGFPAFDLKTCRRWTPGRCTRGPASDRLRYTTVFHPAGRQNVDFSTSGSRRGRAGPRGTWLPARTKRGAATGRGFRPPSAQTPTVRRSRFWRSLRHGRAGLCLRCRGTRIVRQGPCVSFSAQGSWQSVPDEPLTSMFCPARDSQCLASWPEVALPGPMRTCTPSAAVQTA